MSPNRPVPSRAPPISDASINPPLEACSRALLMLLWEHSMIGDEPVVLTDLVREWGLSESDAMAAWEDFRDRGWIGTPNLRGGVWLKMSGSAAAAALDAIRTGLRTPADSGSYLPELPDRLHAPLQALWRASAQRRSAVDAPNFRDDHREWGTALEELAQRRLIAQDLAQLRLTPLGLFNVEESEARAMLLLGYRLRGVLRAHFRDEARRSQAISYSALAAQLGIDRAQLTWTLTHLTDALHCWTDTYVPTFDDPNGHLRPRDGVLTESLFDVARRLAAFAAEYTLEAPSVPSTLGHNFRPPTSDPMPSASTPPSTSTAAPASPTAMICYSHDSPEHRAWVLKLAERLTGAGVNVILDLWHLHAGDEMTRFMEESLAKADYAVLICTEKYVAKADERVGGVGYESTQLAAQLLTAAQVTQKGPRRIVPVIRQAARPPKLPRFADGRLYIDFSTYVTDIDGAFEELVRALHGTPKYVPPPVGRNPFEHQGIAIQVSPVAPSSRPAIDVLRTLRTLRREASAALVARHSGFAQFARSQPEARADQLAKVMGTHETYLERLVGAALRGELTARHLAQEIEDIIVPPGWPQNGYSNYVHLPRVLGWAVHRLAGAALLHQSRASDAVDLARETVAWGEEHRLIVKTHELTGWLIVPRHSREAWEAIRHWPGRFAWLAPLFGDAQELWIAVNAHSMTLNFAEFLVRLAEGPPFEQVRQDREHGPYVPLYFWGETPEVRRRAYRLVTDDQAGLRQRLGTTSTEELRLHWGQWLDFQRAWLAIESDPGRDNHPPHEKLLESLLQTP